MPVSREKARKILRHGSIGGKPLTSSQKGYFGLIAGGGRPTRLKKRKRSPRHEAEVREMERRSRR